MRRRDILHRSGAGMGTILAVGLAGCSGDSSDGEDDANGDDTDDEPDNDDVSDDGDDDVSDDGDDDELGDNEALNLDSPEDAIESFYRVRSGENEEEFGTLLHSESIWRPIEDDDLGRELPDVETEIVEENLSASKIGVEWGFLADYTDEIAEELAEEENAWVEATLTYDDEEDTDSYDHLVVVEDGDWTVWR